MADLFNVVIEHPRSQAPGAVGALAAAIASRYGIPAADLEHTARIVSKIEKPEALKNINEVIQATDAVMVARGDLGVEVPIEKLPGIQKEIVRRCIEQSRPGIVATQIMESMITNPSPTRAEVTDVANAVLDGADAVMLSGGTSVGKHPVRVVEAMSKI